jgi:glycine betaine transporter
MTTEGSLNPPMLVKIVWGVLIAAIAAVLLLSSGLEGLQTASLVSALPFTVILLLMCFTLFKLLRKEILPKPKPKKHKQAQ